MKAIALLALFSFFLLIPLSVNAFECPKHLAKAKAKIDAVSSKMKSMGKMKNMALVHALMDDAKTFYSSGSHNHSKPQGKYDHARSIGKADAAYGFALAAEILMKKL